MANTYNPSTRKAEAGAFPWVCCQLDLKDTVSKNLDLGMVSYACNSSAWEVNIGELIVQGQPDGLETLSPKKWCQGGISLGRVQSVMKAFRAAVAYWMWSEYVPTGSWVGILILSVKRWSGKWSVSISLQCQHLRGRGRRISPTSKSNLGSMHEDSGDF